MPSTKMRGTRVRREPYYDPHNDMWRFLPADTTTQATVSDVDELGQPTPAIPLYESAEKGFVPLRFATEAQKLKLPVNWQDIIYAKGISPKPIFATPGAKTPAA